MSPIGAAASGRARRVARSPSNALGASIWEFQPGSAQFVYQESGKVSTIINGDLRFHRASDEMDHAGPE
jgi:uncharacterized cupin superfamily protein